MEPETEINYNDFKVEHQDGENEFITQIVNCQLTVIWVNESQYFNFCGDDNKKIQAIGNDKSIVYRLFKINLIDFYSDNNNPLIMFKYDTHKTADNDYLTISMIVGDPVDKEADKIIYTINMSSGWTYREDRVIRKANRHRIDHTNKLFLKQKQINQSNEKMMQQQSDKIELLSALLVQQQTEIKILEKRISELGK